MIYLHDDESYVKLLQKSILIRIFFMQNNEYRRTLSRNDNRKKVRCRVTNPLFYDIIDYNEVDTVSFSEFYELNVTCTYKTV